MTARTNEPQKERGEDMANFIAGFLLGLFILIFFINGSHSYTDIIRHGCGEYNSITGQFQWRTPNDRTD